MSAHARLSPSSAHRWMRCPGSVLLCEKEPDLGSSYAAEGTAAHDLAEKCLNQGVDPSNYLGERVGDFEVTEDMANHVRKYIDFVKQKGQLFAEYKLPISQLTGETDAIGTSDAVIIDGETLSIVDLKYGMGVRVDAEDNEQLMLYGLAALDEFSFMRDFKTVKLCIVQPRLDHISEVEMPVSELEAFRTKVKAAAEAVARCTEFSLYLTPGAKQCRFCKAKATCPAIAQAIAAKLTGDEVDLTAPFRPQLEDVIARVERLTPAQLGECMDSLDLIEGWVKAVRAKTEVELLQGRDVPGYKLVEGRKGSRKWADEKAVVSMITAFDVALEDVSELILNSPTTIEKRFKGSDMWDALQNLITQTAGRPSVAPSSDKRPALKQKAIEDCFDQILNLVTMEI